MASKQASPVARRLEIEGDFSTVPCGQCAGLLDFHQPDVELAHRILATCGDCGSWYLLDLARGWMLAFPRFETLHEA